MSTDCTLDLYNIGVVCLKAITTVESQRGPPQLHVYSAHKDVGLHATVLPPLGAKACRNGAIRLL